MKVKTDSTKCQYVTAGKEYETFDTCESGFWMIDDEGDKISCLFDEDLHLDLDSWEVIEEKP